MQKKAIEDLEKGIYDDLFVYMLQKDYAMSEKQVCFT